MMKKNYLSPHNRVVEVVDGYLASPSGENENVSKGDDINPDPTSTPARQENNRNYINW